MFRYDVSGHVAFGGHQARPLMRDRWTGMTYVYYANEAELSLLGQWAEVIPREFSRTPDAPWVKQPNQPVR